MVAKYRLYSLDFYIQLVIDDYMVSFFINNLSVLFKMFIPAAEFDQSSVVECLLVIAYELLTII